MSGPSQPGRSILLRVLVWIGGLCCALLVLLLLLFSVENGRGQRAWAACQRELAVQGEQLDLKAFVPPPIPDDQNFVATPLFAGLNYRSGRGGPGQMDWPSDYDQAQRQAKKPRQADQRRRGDSTAAFHDLPAWQHAFRIVRTNDADQPIPVTAPPGATAEMRAALEVLEALKVYDPPLNELREAARRPSSRFPVEYEAGNPMEILLPHLARLKGICLVLQLRVAAQLAAGRSDAALDDVLLMLRVTDSVKDEPILISQLVRNACFQLSARAINVGLASRKWTEPQLRPLQARLQKYDFTATAQQALRAERAFGLACLEFIRRGPAPRGQAGNLDDPFEPAQVYRRFLPSGWLRFEQANYCRALQAMLLPDSDIQQHRINPQLVDQKQAEFEQTPRQPWKVILEHRIFTHLLVPALSKTYAKFALAQTVTDQAALACALERYRLANGEFPETLEALVPAYIQKVPADVISGEPMRYRRTPDSQFVLWSVAWNDEDEGGVPGESVNDTRRGDWVWECPEK